MINMFVKAVKCFSIEVERQYNKKARDMLKQI